MDSARAKWDLEGSLGKEHKFKEMRRKHHAKCFQILFGSVLCAAAIRRSEISSLHMEAPSAGHRMYQQL